MLWDTEIRDSGKENELPLAPEFATVSRINASIDRGFHRTGASYYSSEFRGQLAEKVIQRSFQPGQIDTIHCA